MMDKSSVDVTVHGRVQGVGYRAFAESSARQAGLCGYVYNMQDGVSVRIHAEGERAKLEKYIIRLKRGPFAAKVAKMDIDWAAPIENSGDFDIRY